MQYYVRVAIGFALGALIAVGFALFTGRFVPAGALGAALGVAGFLATFFVWSADRLPEYEQVLFDGRNVVHCLVMVALLVGVAFGSTFLHHSPAPVDPTLAKMDADHDRLTRVYNDIEAGKLDAAGVASAKTSVADITKELATFPDSPKLALLDKAAKAVTSGLDAYDKCGDKLCQAATLALLDARKPLNDYAA